MSVTYRNTATGETVTFAGLNPPLDRAAGWEQVEDEKKTAKAKADVPKPSVSADNKE